MAERRIRPLALAVIRRGDEILVEEGRDETKGETFFRLPGGAIDFGELGADAVARELCEELGSEVEVTRYLATFENIFTWEGQPGHELVLVYECTHGDARLRARDAWEAHETTADGRVTHRFAWKRLDGFGAGGEILYPEGLAPLLAR